MRQKPIEISAGVDIGTGRKATIWQAWDSYDAAETDAFYLTRREAVSSLVDRVGFGHVLKHRIELSSAGFARALRLIPMR